MNLLAVGDFHERDDLKDALHEELASGDYDFCILAGDYESREYYEELVDGISIPFLALTGNWDFGFDPPENDEYEMLFNYKEVEYKDYRIVLLGSVYPDDFQDKIRDFFEGAPDEKCIIASHYPPHMLGDLTDMGTRAGFPEFREVIMREKPVAWLCGHIHEDYGRFELLKTAVFNCSAKESGKGWKIVLGDDGIEEAEEVELLE